jgi:hypothetical protein
LGDGSSKIPGILLKFFNIEKLADFSQKLANLVQFTLEKNFFLNFLICFGGENHKICH